MMHACNYYMYINYELTILTQPPNAVTKDQD